MAIREKVFSTTLRVFKRHGAVTIDTPVFELREVLTGKYGEDSKLIYDLADQGGELCSLRYDLTVPFARYLAMNKNISHMKRFHIAKVYRRDQPALTKGRFREFYQCDFDIAGQLAPLLPDAEVFKVIAEILTELDIGSFEIKCNNRLILDGIFEFCGVPQDKFRAVCSAVDKLDKLSWTEVKREITEQKGIDPEVADRIGEYVYNKRGSLELLSELLASPLASNERAREGLEQLVSLEKYLGVYEISNVVVFDMSLARGLDYYTGVIFEAVLVGGEVGSIAGGGRYDNLVGMFSKSKQQIPCVGVSFGVERVFSILEARALINPSSVRQSPVQVYVAAAGSDLTLERMRLCKDLWRAGINAEMSQKNKLKALDQFGYCEKNNIPWCIVLGPEEMQNGMAKIRNVADRTEEQVELEAVVQKVQNRVKQSSLTDSFANQFSLN